MLAVDEREQARLFALEELLDHHVGPGVAELACDHALVDRGERFRDRHRDDDALPGREPVGLDHDRRALRLHIGARRRGIGEAPVARGRDVKPRAEVFHEALRAFEPRRRRRGAEGLDARFLEPVGEAGHKGALGPDDDEIDLFLAREIDEARNVLGADGHALGLRGDAGIAGRAKELVAERRAGDGPAQRVLAPARSHDEYPHPRSLPAGPICHAGAARRRKKDQQEGGETGRRKN